MISTVNGRKRASIAMHRCIDASLHPYWQRSMRERNRPPTCSVFLRLLWRRVVCDLVLAVGAEWRPIRRVQVYVSRGRCLQSVDLTHQPVRACLRLIGAHVLTGPAVKPRPKLLVQAQGHLLMSLQHSKPYTYILYWNGQLVWTPALGL